MSATFTATVAAVLASLLGTAGPADGPAPGVATIMAVIMATVFTVAAIGKLRSPESTASELTLLRLPAGRMLARLLPPIELATAALLLARPAAGAVAAFLLLLGFTAVLAAAVRSGLTVSCGCLGAVSRAPVTSATVARNVAFMVMTAMVATTPSLVVPDLASIMLTVTVSAMAGLTLQLMTLRNELGRLWSVELAGEARSQIANPANPANRRTTAS